MRTAYYETKCGGLTVERRSRRSRTEAQRRKLVRVRENIGAAMMLLGFLLLMVIGGAEDLTVIFLGGLAGLSLMLLGGWLGHAFYGQEKDAEWLRRRSRTKMYSDRDSYQKSVRRAREERWRVRGRARVVHPKYGAVVVPHRSNYSALLNAAEYWGCEWTDIRDAEVWAVSDGTAVVMPKEFCRRN